MLMNTAEDVMQKISLELLITGLVDLPDPLPAELRVQVGGVKMDSRLLEPGDLFIACFGSNHDARDYIDFALGLGVSAVLAESGEAWHGIQYRHGVPVIAVDNLSTRISEIAGRFYGNPSHELTVIGITGTNGKTTTVTLLCTRRVRSFVRACITPRTAVPSR